jgi:hypothetical protein
MIKLYAELLRLQVLFPVTEQHEKVGEMLAGRGGGVGEFALIITTELAHYMTVRNETSNFFLQGGDTVEFCGRWKLTCARCVKMCESRTSICNRPTYVCVCVCVRNYRFVCRVFPLRDSTI